MKTKLKRLLKNIVLPLSQRQALAGAAPLLADPSGCCAGGYAETAAVRKSILAVALCAVGLSAFAAEPDAVQLWEDGPYFATCNIGAEKPEDYGILTNFNDAAQAVTDALGDGWRVPSDAELKMLAGKNDGDQVCSNVWTTCNGVKGCRFFGMTSGYEDKSIFLPAAGFNRGSSRLSAGVDGYFWSSAVKDGDNAWYLYFKEGNASVYSSVRTGGMSVRAVRDTPPPVTYLDWDDVNKKLTNAVCTAYEVVTNGMNAFEAGKTYAVLGNVTNTTGITVKGTPSNPSRLILCDGAELVVKSDDNKAGITVAAARATTNALVICGQAKSTGRLTATGGYRGAGIGGGIQANGGTVTINGGTVTATGDYCGAGIGGGVEGAGGTVTINGGAVAATGGDCGAGIGGGFNGVGGTVTINGGTVTVTAGADDIEGPTVAIGGGELAKDQGTVTFGEGVLFSVVTGKTAAVTAPIAQEDYEKDHIAAYVHIEPVKPEISAVSAEGFLDLTVGDRVAEAEEPIVADPKWGNGKKAFVKIDGEDPAREYPELSIDKWFTSALTAGRYGMTFTSGETNETAVFWKTGDDWVVQDLPPSSSEGIFFESGKTHLILGSTTFVGAAPLTVEDGAKFEYGTGAGFKGGKLEAPRRYAKVDVEGGLYQIVEKIKGCEDNPWEVGVGVEAYTNGTDNLVIVGAGTIMDLSEIPLPVKRGIAAITINTGVADAAAGTFYGFDKVTVTLPDNWQGELPDEKNTWCGATNVKLTRWPMAVKNVKPQQRYPWNGLVDIDFALSGEGSVKVTLSVTTNGVKAVENPTVTGETTFDLGTGKELKDLRITWDAKADFGDEEKHERIKVKLTVSPGESD